MSIDLQRKLAISRRNLESIRDETLKYHFDYYQATGLRCIINEILNQADAIKTALDEASNAVHESNEVKTD